MKGNRESFSRWSGLKVEEATSWSRATTLVDSLYAQFC